MYFTFGTISFVSLQPTYSFFLRGSSSIGDEAATGTGDRTAALRPVHPV